MSFVDTLTSKVGPLPVWAYGAMGGGVVGIFLWRQRSKRASEGGEAEDSVSTSDVISEEDEGLVDTAGWGAYPYANSAVANMPAALQDDSLATMPVNPQTGNPYAIDVALPINPATGNPYQVDFTLGEERNARLEADIDRLAAENERIVNAPPAAIPSPEIVAPTPPAPVVTTPAPSPRPPSNVPARGTVIWSGANRPNQNTINNLIRERYGRPVSWRTVDRGAGKTPRYQVVTQ